MVAPLSHVKSVCRSAYFQLRTISNIRHMLPQRVAEQLTHAFNTLLLDTCNSLLFGHPDALIKKNCKWCRMQLCARWPGRENTTTSRQSFDSCTGFLSRSVLFLRSFSWHTRPWMALLQVTLPTCSSSTPQHAVFDLLVNTCYLCLGPASTTLAIKPFQGLHHDYGTPCQRTSKCRTLYRFSKESSKPISFKWILSNRNFKIL